jgi:uncharacterized protein involved in type VI secretion and phage assembly
MTNQPPLARSAPDPGCGIDLGIVSAVDSQTGRVKVRCPAQNDQETDWLQVVSPGGGPKTGLYALPRLNDRVVLLWDRDPSRALVLGGVVGADGPSLDLEDGILPTQLRCREGHGIELTPGTVRIEHAGGARAELRANELSLRHPDGSHVLLNGKGITLSAAGQTLTFIANRVDFVHS